MDSFRFRGIHDILLNLSFNLHRLCRFIPDYDATSLTPTLSAPTDFHQTVFPVSSSSILQAAGKLADKRREKRAFTVSWFGFSLPTNASGLIGAFLT